MTVKAFGDIARVSVLPNCNFCIKDTPADYDARFFTGSWAYMCQRHFTMLECELGLGKGQRLVLEFLE